MYENGQGTRNKTSSNAPGGANKAIREASLPYSMSGEVKEPKEVILAPTDQSLVACVLI